MKTYAPLLMMVLLAGCPDRPASGAAEPAANPNANAVWYAAVDKADALKDGLARCLAYPDPPGYHWPKALVHALCADFKQPVVQANTVRSLIDASDWKGLRELYDGYLRRHYAGTDPEQLLYRVFPRASWHNAREADEYSTRWLAAAPDDPYANTLRAKVLLEQAWEVRGTQFAKDVPADRMNRAMVLAEESGRLAERAVQLEPKVLPAYQQILSVAALTADYRKFDAALEAALSQSPDNYYVRSTALSFMEPKWGGSIQEMDRLVEGAQKHLGTNPRLVLLRTQRTALDSYKFSRLKQSGPALDVYRRAIAMGPEPSVVDMAAYEARDSGRPAEAVFYFSQSMRFSKGSPLALTNRGVAWEAMGEFDRALRDYAEAAELLPGDADTYFRMALVEHRQKNYKAAGGHYLKTLELAPNNADAMKNACRMWVHLTEEPLKAKPYAEKLVVLRPGDPESWLLLANVQHDLGDPATRETAQHFLQLADPQDPRWKESVELIQRFLKGEG